MRHLLAAAALALLASGCVPSVGTQGLPVPPDAGPVAGGGEPDAGGGGTPDAGGGGGGGGDAGVPPADGGTTPVACAAEGAACGATAQCCSNRCPSGLCGAMCLADGQPCAKATDCCSLACNGTCGSGGLCKQDGADCPTGSNLECCSNSCQGNRCVADKSSCHPAGERCSGGGFRQNGCCDNATCIAQGQATEHCALPPSVCAGEGVPCSLASECCSNACVAGTCTKP
jgi:hypothetical protein